jgi:hypothetical protein
MNPTPIPRRRLRSMRLASLVVAASALTVTRPALAAPTPHDCVASSEEALSFRKQDKLGAAKARLLVCVDPSCPAEIREECARRLPEVTDAIPSVVFDVKDAAGNDMSAVRVSMDGAPLVDHIGAAAVSIDPGEHAFRFDGADASQSVEKRVVIRDGEKNRHLAVVFGPMATSAAAAGPVVGTPAAEPTAAPTATFPPSAARPPASEQPSAHSRSSQKTLALVAGGLGIVGIGVGSVFGILTFSTWSKAKNECGTSCPPPSQAQSDKDTATSQATISTVGFVVGSVLVVGGVVLWFKAPSGATVQVAPNAGAQGAGMTIRGTF